MQDFEGGRMNGVAAKISQKIGMLLQNDDIDAGPGEKKPKL